MTETGSSSRRGTQRVLMVMLLLCTGWLIVQNAVLLALIAWAGPQSAVTMGRALVKVGLALLEQGWWVPLATLLVLLLVAGGLRSEGRREVRHG
jgi:hypothetical protein